jgi:AraC-like DNA-binding protein
MSLTASTLFRGDVVTVRHVACRPSGTAAGAIEYGEADRVVLPVRGVFVKHLSRTVEVMAEPTQALLFAAGRPYRVSHPAGAPDECLTLEFAPDALHDVLATAGADSLVDTALRPHASLAPAALAVRHLLWRRLERGIAGRLEVDEVGLALLASVAAGARRGVVRRTPRPGTRARRQSQAAAVREALLAAPARKWTLHELARLAYTTPHHLARLFHAEIGIPVHQYHLRVRLARSLDLLLDTGQGLSTIAHELGFSSHSHFTAAFGRMVGVTPAHFRRCASAAQAREVRTILIERLPSCR